MVNYDIINLLYLLYFEKLKKFSSCSTSLYPANWNFYSWYFPVEGPVHAWLIVAPALISMLDKGRLRVPVTQPPFSSARQQKPILLGLWTDLDFFSWFFFIVTKLLLRIWLIIVPWGFQPLHSVDENAQKNWIVRWDYLINPWVLIQKGRYSTLIYIHSNL